MHEHGIEIKILSGDNDAVVRTIARQVGIRTDNALTGPIFETMSEEEKMKAVNQTTAFSKLTPIQKTEIITLLQAQQHTVGFLGDGINDAAALRQSDIGISVDSAVDIAKESADIILLEKSLMVLEDGVLEGRKTFGNITKYIKMTASSNFGNMFSVMAASAFLPFLPMLPIHLLIQNLLYDISQTLIVHMIRTRQSPLHTKLCLLASNRTYPADYGHRYPAAFHPVWKLYRAGSTAIKLFPLAHRYPVVLLHIDSIN